MNERLFCDSSALVQRGLVRLIYVSHFFLRMEIVIHFLVRLFLSQHKRRQINSDIEDLKHQINSDIEDIERKINDLHLLCDQVQREQGEIRHTVREIRDQLDAQAPPGQTKAGPSH